ncbi:MAG: isocitrate/isopropylmalate family dehydrogenase, partial [Candidatus Methanoperedens sp.]|nr:isocitrate/isopropylmalate family dehydrogenase [Candidatus Methanoperedens sp.]
MRKKAAVIKGDGVGPELVNSMLRVVEAAGTKVEFITCEAGEGWWKEHGGDSLMPLETWDILGKTDAGFKGPTTTPGGAGSPKSVA